MRPRAFERGAAVLGCAGILTAALLAGGCSQLLGIEELSPGTDAMPPPLDALPPPDMDPGGFAVRGMATGVLGPVALELGLGGDVELLTVTQDGSFAFATRLEDDASYTVALADPDVPCMLSNAVGVISGADAAIELDCAGALLASVVVSGIAPVIALEPGTDDYVVELPLLQQVVTVAASVASAGDTLVIAGTSVANGEPSAPITLSLGDNPVDIVVENDLGWQRTYRLTLRRAEQLAQYAYGKASNTGAEDYFGYSVALAGDTLAVGAAFEASSARGVDGDQDNDSARDSGAVYVFRRQGATWRQEAYLKASNTDGGDEFGASVALAGDTLVVGADLEDSASLANQEDDAATDSGAVYVFRRAGTTWQQEAYIKASNIGAGDQFGISMALSGDILAVGANLEDSSSTGINDDPNNNGATDSGAVYVFRRAGTTWQQEAYIKASNTGSSDQFGINVAFAGDILAVGANLEDSSARGINGVQGDNAALESGAVYVFRRTGTGAWQPEAYIKASNTGANDRFGTSVALSGDTLAVGAQFEDGAATGVNGTQDDGATDTGAVYVFRRTGTTWEQQAYIKSSNTGDTDLFGGSVALSGDTLAVGGYLEDSASTGVDGNQNDDTLTNSGAVYMFRRTGTTWEQQAYLKASNSGDSDLFGISMALSGDTLAVGGYLEDSGASEVNGDQADESISNGGAVYIFH